MPHPQKNHITCYVHSVAVRSLSWKLGFKKKCILIAIVLKLVFFQIYLLPLIQGWIVNLAGPDGRRRVEGSAKARMNLRKKYGSRNGNIGFIEGAVLFL